MQKSTKIMLITILVFVIVAFIFKDIRLTESYADYSGCTPEQIEMGCHGDAVRTNLLGLVTPISIMLVFIISLGFGTTKIIQKIKEG